MPRVSVIIPTYNRAGFLKTAADSVLKQSFRDVELIIVDDGSTDTTQQMIAEYGDRIIYISQDNKGPAAARNLGIKKATGDFIAFLDSDDRWRRKKLARQLDFFDAQEKNCLITHTEEIWYRNGEHLNPLKKHRKKSGDLFEQALELCAISMSTVMVKKEIFDAVGYFDESFPVCEDYEFWLRVTASFEVLLLDEKLTLKEGGHDDQVSRQYPGHMDKYRIAAITKLLDSGSLWGKRFDMAVDALHKKCDIYAEGCRKYGKPEEADFYRKLVKKYMA